MSTRIKPVDHAAEARSIMKHLGSVPMESGAAIVSAIAAQTHATLALVEQQRIANLIALAQVRVGATDLPVFRHLVMEAKGLSDYDVQPTAAIREGLGL